MKICPKCHEKNSDVMDKCYLCGTPLGAATVGSGKKICTSCQEITTSSGSSCPVCGGRLVTYSGGSVSGGGSHSHYKPDSTIEVWEWVLSLIFFFMGFILGFIHLAKDDKEGGKKLLIFESVMLIVWGIMFYISR